MNYWNCISARLACNIQSFCSFYTYLCIVLETDAPASQMWFNATATTAKNWTCLWRFSNVNGWSELNFGFQNERGGRNIYKKYIIWNIFHSLGPSILNICLTDPFGMRFVGCHFQLDCGFWYNTNILAREYSGYFNNKQDKPETLHIFRWWHQQTDEHNMVCCWLMSLYSSVWMCVYCLFGSIRFGSVQWL